MCFPSNRCAADFIVAQSLFQKHELFQRDISSISIYKGINSQTKEKCLIQIFSGNDVFSFKKFLFSIQAHAILYNHPAILRMIGHSSPFTKEPMIFFENSATKKIHEKFQSELQNNQNELRVLDLNLIKVLNPTAKLKTLYGIASALCALHSIGLAGIDGNCLQMSNFLIDEIGEPHLASLICFSSPQPNQQYNQQQQTNNQMNNCERKISGNDCIGEIVLCDAKKKMDISHKNINICQQQPGLMRRIISPEKVKTMKSDVFALGIIASKLIMNSNIQNNKLSHSFSFLISRCLSQNPDSRPTSLEFVSFLRTCTINTIIPNVDENEYKNYVSKLDEFLKPQKIDLSTMNFVGRLFHDRILHKSQFKHIRTFRRREEEKVQLFEDSVSKKKYVFKFYRSNDNDSLKFEKQKKFMREAEALSRVDHPAICSIAGIDMVNVRGKLKHGIMLEYHENGDLESKYCVKSKLSSNFEFVSSNDSLNSKNNTLNNTQKMIVLFGLASAMYHLHQLHFVHRNIRPSSILFDNRNYPVLSGFDFSRNFNNEEFEFQSSITSSEDILYKSPETFETNLTINQPDRIDVYSFGLVAYFLFNGFHIHYQITNKKERDRKIKNGELPPFDFPEDICPSSLREFIVKCVSRNPQDRPSSSDILTFLLRPENRILNIDQNEFAEYLNFCHPRTHRKNHRINKTINLIETNKQFEIMNKRLISESIVNENDYKFDPSKWDHRGSYSTVYIATEKKEPFRKVVLKMYDKKIKIDKNFQRSLFREIEILDSLNHPVIVKLLGHNFVNPSSNALPFIVLEYLSNGTIEDLILKHDTEKLTPTVRMKTMFAIASVLEYLHRIPIVHRDLKPDNIMLDENLNPRLLDFNQSKLIESYAPLDASIRPGAALYHAPEFDTGKYTPSVDIFSLGIIMYQLYTLERLFSDTNRAEKVEKRYKNGIRPEIHGDNDLVNLIKRCWSHNPESRPAASEVAWILRKTDYHIEGTNIDEYDKYVSFIDEKFEPGDFNVNVKEKDGIFSKNIKKQCQYKKIETIKDTPSYSVTIRQRKFGKDKTKILFKEIKSESTIEKTRFLREIEILSKINHPSIIKLKGCDLLRVVGNFKPAFYVEYKERGNLYKILKPDKNTMNDNGASINGNFNNTNKMITLIGISSALANLHAKNYVVRDLKPSHIVFDEELNPFISGLGASKIIIDNFQLNNSINTSDPTFSAPEFLRTQKQSQDKKINLDYSVDVYSFGMIAYFLLSEKIPFDGLTSKEKEKIILRTNIKEKVVDFSEIKEIKPELRNVLQNCVSKFPEERPTSAFLSNFLFNEQDFWLDGCNHEIVNKFCLKTSPYQIFDETCPKTSRSVESLLLEIENLSKSAKIEKPIKLITNEFIKCADPNSQPTKIPENESYINNNNTNIDYQGHSWIIRRNTNPFSNSPLTVIPKTSPINSPLNENEHQTEKFDNQVNHQLTPPPRKTFRQPLSPLTGEFINLGLNSANNSPIPITDKTPQKKTCSIFKPPPLDLKNLSPVNHMRRPNTGNFLSPSFCASPKERNLDVQKMNGKNILTVKKQNIVPPTSTIKCALSPPLPVLLS